MMTSTARRLKVGVFSASVATFLMGSSFAFCQQQGYVSPSPFGSTSRLAGVNFANTGLTSVGFQNTGFQNTGFRNVGFQNVGFRNYAPSVSGLQRPFGSSYSPYAPRGLSNLNNGFGNQVPAYGNQATAPVISNGNYGAAPVQYSNGINPNSLGYQGQGFAPDDTATVVIGPGTTLNSGVSGPPLSRGARYTLSLGFDSPVGVVTNPRLSEELQRQFTNSSRFGAGNNIKVAVENNVVVLRGKVADEHERDLAEVLVRLSPGVYNVQNDLQVQGDVAAANR
jgi:hypothetical protein